MFNHRSKELNDALEGSSSVVPNENSTAPLLGDWPGAKTSNVLVPKWQWMFIVAWCTVNVVISYADRTNISTAILEMKKEFNWSEKINGTVLSVFFVGYAITQALGGRLADKLGGKWVLLVGMTSWSIFTFFTPHAAKAGLGPLLTTRVLMGLGEGVGFPAIHSIISANVPGTFFSTAVSIVTTASYGGALFAFAISPWIISKWGWPTVFYSFGLLAVIWLPPWIFTPIHKRNVDSAVEKDFKSILWSPGLGRLLLKMPVLAICIAQYTQCWGMFVLINWLPTFFQDKYGIPVAKMGLYTALPYVLQCLGGLSSGILADVMLKRGRSVKFVRRLFQSIGMIGPAVCLSIVVSPFMPKSAGLCSVLISIGTGLSSLTLGGVSVSHLDITPRHAGLVFGLGNTAGTLAGFLGVYITGWLLEVTKSWVWVFGVTVVHYLVGTVVWIVWVGGDVLPEDFRL